MTIRNVFFIDWRVSDRESLIAALPANSVWYLLEPESDGVGQMRQVLAEYRDLESIQILSHGSEGTLYLGSTVLTSDNPGEYADELAAIGSSLTDYGDILLYGCDLAQGDLGQQFINQIARYAGADVAASTDVTGNAELGGDWALEYTSGSIETSGLTSSDFASLLAVITGWSSHDLVDTFPPSLVSRLELLGAHAA
jgi:hypothetical protein